MKKIQEISLNTLSSKMSTFQITHENFASVLINYASVRIIKDLREEAYDWCESTLGDNWIWSDPVHTEYTEIYFKHRDDALVFKLKYGH